MKSNHDLSRDSVHLSSFESFPGSQWGRLPACGPYCGPPHFHPATHPDSHQPYCPAPASCLLSDLFGNLSWTESASEIEISLLNPQAWLTNGSWMLQHLFNNFPNQRNVTRSLLSARHSKRCKPQHQHKNSASSSLRAVWGPWWLPMAKMAHLPEQVTTSGMAGSSPGQGSPETTLCSEETSNVRR